MSRTFVISEPCMQASSAARRHSTMLFRPDADCDTVGTLAIADTIRTEPVCTCWKQRSRKLQPLGSRDRFLGLTIMTFVVWSSTQNVQFQMDLYRRKKSNL